MKIDASTDCPCTADCDRHANCVACVAHHRDKRLPTCLRAGREEEVPSDTVKS